MVNLEVRILTVCDCLGNQRPYTKESASNAPRFAPVFNNSIPATARGEAKDYQEAMDSLLELFKPRKNALMARQAFIAASPIAGETINNFITRLQKLAEHCEYEDESSARE